MVARVTSGQRGVGVGTAVAAGDAVEEASEGASELPPPQATAARRAGSRRSESRKGRSEGIGQLLPSMKHPFSHSNDRPRADVPSRSAAEERAGEL